MTGDNCGTKTELAQRLGVSVKRVTSAIERGEIKPQRVGKNVRGQRCIVDMAGAEADFVAIGSGVSSASSVSELPELPEGLDPLELGPGEGLMPPAGIDLQTARTIREWWGALRERARHEREQGEWAKREDVRRDAFVIARAARDAILRVPDRVCDDLAAEADGARVRERLRSELTRILEDLSAGLEKLCGESAL